jgi:hypothetical protein
MPAGERPLTNCLLTELCIRTGRRRPAVHSHKDAIRQARAPAGGTWVWEVTIYDREAPADPGESRGRRAGYGDYLLRPSM